MENYSNKCLAPDPARGYFLAGDGYSEAFCGGPLKVMSTKCGVRDPEIQVLMFDIEALICNLLTEEHPLLVGNYWCYSSV